MKVIQVTPRYYPYIGGIETHVREISNRLAQRNIDITVVTTDPSHILDKEEILEGVHVKRFNSYAPGDSFYFCPDIYFFLNKNKCNILHIHGYHVLSSLFAAMTKASTQKVIFTPHYHGAGHTLLRNILYHFYKPFGEKIFDKADHIICVSEYEKNLIKTNFKIPDSKIVIIPNGVKLDDFKDISSKKLKNNNTLLYVGRLEEYKGVQYLLKALPELNGYRLEIIGKGPYKKVLMDMAEKLGVSTRICWLEDIPRNILLQHYVSASIFVMLSKHEAYGITVAEALASGTPCIVAKGSALEEFVDGEKCIGIDPPVTVNKLINSIKYLKDSKIENQIMTNIKIKDWDEVTNKLIDVYRAIQ